MALPEKLILVCQSFRLGKEPKGICHKQTDGFLQYIEEEILDRGLDVQVVATGCLKQCESGPIMVIQPENWWFKGVNSEAAIDAIAKLRPTHILGVPTMLQRIAADGRLAQVLGDDPARNDFAPDSPVIAMTTPEISDILLPFLPGMALPELLDRMNQLAADAPMVPAVDLPAVLGALRARGLKLGLANNDTEVPARRHLAGAGVLDLFDFVVGCDSGFGGKPAPGQLLAFVQHCGLTPGRVAMVGGHIT